MMAKSLAPRVFGILSIIFSLLVFLLVVVKGLSMATYSPELEGAMVGHEIGDAKAARAAIVTFHDKTRVPKAINALVFALMSAVLFGVGLGQLRYRPWALRATLLWAIAGLVALLGVGWLEVAWVHPLSRELQAALEAAAQHGGPQARTMALVAGFMTGSLALSMIKLSIYVPYPVVLLFYFTRRRVEAALAAQGAREEIAAAP